MNEDTKQLMDKLQKRRDAVIADANARLSEIDMFMQMLLPHPPKAQAGTTGGAAMQQHPAQENPGGADKHVAKEEEMRMIISKTDEKAARRSGK